MPTRISDENESTAYFLTKQTADIQYVNQAGDSMQGDLDMNNNRITNVKYPIASADTASKLYVDSNLARITSFQNNTPANKQNGYPPPWWWRAGTGTGFQQRSRCLVVQTLR